MAPLQIATVLGARPQFVKAAVVTRALAEQGVDEVLVHTGQHYDWEMSQAFFEGLGLPEPGEENLHLSKSIRKIFLMQEFLLSESQKTCPI